MVTKHRDLGINASIVVSSTGFTTGAILKANAYNVRAISMEEGFGTDWVGLLIDLKTVCWGEVTSTIKRVVAYTGTGASGQVGLDQVIVNEARQPVVTLEQLIAHGLTEMRLLDGVTPGRTGMAMLEFVPSDTIFVLDTSGTPNQIVKFVAELGWKAPTRIPISVRKGRIEKSAVAFGTGRAEPREEAKAIELYLIGRRGKPATCIASVSDREGAKQEVRLTPTTEVLSWARR